MEKMTMEEARANWERAKRDWEQAKKDWEARGIDCGGGAGYVEDFLEHFREIEEDESENYAPDWQHAAGFLDCMREYVQSDDFLWRVFLNHRLYKFSEELDRWDDLLGNISNNAQMFNDFDLENDPEMKNQPEGEPDPENGNPGSILDEYWHNYCDLVDFEEYPIAKKAKQAASQEGEKMKLETIEAQKPYFEQQYKAGLLDYMTARTKEDKDKALADLARVYNLASRIYGFEFADSLQERYKF